MTDKIQPREKVDVTTIKNLVDACTTYIDSLDDYCEDEMKEHVINVFEAALELVYGPNVWYYVNEKIDDCEEEELTEE